MNDKANLRADKAKIRKVLMEIWDPIGINEYPEAQDEYDAYIGPVYVLLKRNALDSEIVHYLTEVETQRMGLPFRDKELLLPVVTSLKSLSLLRPER